MKIKNVLVLSLLLCVSHVYVYAQYQFVPDMTGKQLTDAKYVDLTGTPYFIDQWLNGEVKLSDGKIIKPTEIKYDMVEDKLLFQAEGKIFEFSPPVLSFTLHTKEGIKTFVKKDQAGSVGGYFQVLNQGKIKLLKKNRKSILEVKGYNSANVNKTVDENKRYFVNANGRDIEVKLTKNYFLESFPEYKSQIESFDLKSNKKNIEDVFGRLVDTF